MVGVGPAQADPGQLQETLQNRSVCHFERSQLPRRADRLRARRGEREREPEESLL